jgi:hypothetical protein
MLAIFVPAEESEGPPEGVVAKAAVDDAFAPRIAPIAATAITTTTQSVINLPFVIILPLLICTA